MRKYLLLIPLLLFAGDYGKIVGKVVDGKTGKPIHRANVVVENANRGASTNENGEYEIFYVPVGTYSVCITHRDYSSETHYNTEINAGESIVLDFHLDFVGSFAFFDEYISKYVPDDEIKKFSDSLIIIYDFVLKQLENPLLSARGKNDWSLIVYRILRKLVETGDVRVDSLAIECLNSSNLQLIRFAVTVFQITKAPIGTSSLLHLLKRVPLVEKSENEFVIITTLGAINVMYVIVQIGTPALPYLESALADTNELFRQRVAVMISRIGTTDSVLVQKVGPILVKTIETRSDSFILEQAIRGVGKLMYRDGISAIMGILMDKDLIDKYKTPFAYYLYTPNNTAKIVLEKYFNIPVEQSYPPDSVVYEFTDLNGIYHKVTKESPYKRQQEEAKKLKIIKGDHPDDIKRDEK